jgi:mannose/cellobiose epimerase-like protein (N-acyl-D-glucosamine 2-epimerase family)
MTTMDISTSRVPAGGEADSTKALQGAGLFMNNARMTTPSGQARLAARKAQTSLSSWLVSSAYPLWSTRGVDVARGGFQERLQSDGTPTEEPRRARVQPRQVYCFAHAPALGWSGDAKAVVNQGLDFFLKAYRRPDGLFRALVAPDGKVLDDKVVLYDQAFALLAFAEARRVLGPTPHLDREARHLLLAIQKTMKGPGWGFQSGIPHGTTLLSNPHMHLFEASLAWIAVDDGVVWHELADHLGALALSRFIDSASGALREHFDFHWLPVRGVDGRIVEPGHQYEWAWLLMRWASAKRTDVKNAALRLIEIAEEHGVRHGVAVNSLLDDFSIHDEVARLWPQTERVKAAALAARITHDECYWTIAASAANSLLRYLETDVRGLWYDRLTPDGSFIREPAPASSFYHIVAAISELTASLDATESQ